MAGRGKNFHMMHIDAAPPLPRCRATLLADRMNYDSPEIGRHGEISGIRQKSDLPPLPHCPRGTPMANSASYARWSLEPYSIGLKLRVLRTRKRLTLARLAAETGLSTALLSKLETDRMIPTLPTLAQICRVYGVGLSYFFQEPESHTLSITRRANLQGSSRGPETVRRIPLNSMAPGARLAVEMVEIPPGAACCSSPVDQPACGVVYVLEGRMRLDVGGSHEVLEAGDCAYMESRFTATWSAVGQHRCRLLLVTPAGSPPE